MEINKKLLVEIRQELHERIFNEFQETESVDLRIIRKPNLYWRQPAPKMIIVVESNEQAQILKEKCLNLIAKANNRLINELQKCSLYKHYELKYSINILPYARDIMLTVGDAQRRNTITGSQIKINLQALYTKLSDKWQTEYEFFGTKEDKKTVQNNHLDKLKRYMNECIAGLDDDQNYIFAESTGKSYRLTYYDGSCRKQISLGNLLIIVGSTDVRIMDKPQRKTRADRKQALYVLDFAEVGQIYIYQE